MNEQRLQAYYQLIESLLNSPNGEEPEILAANTELLDAGFLQVLAAVADNFAQQGEENSANRLRNLATQLTPENTPMNSKDIDTYGQFVQEVLLKTKDSNGDAQVVYPLLEVNTDKLNHIFAELLRDRATNILAEADIAATIENFSNLIQQFPLGSKANNMEIAIAGYEIALTVYTRSAFSVDWARMQNNLGIAYGDRILGERAENIESAIKAYNKALLIYTRTTFPESYVETSYKLGSFYKKSQRLISAYITLESTIETIEFLFRKIVDSKQTSDVVEQWNKIYYSLIEVCVELKEYTEAIRYIELTKTRRLMKSLLPKIQSEIEAEKIKLQQLEKDNQQNISLKNLMNLHEQRESLVSRVRRSNPLQFSEIQNILDNETAIIQFYISHDYFCAFIITRNNDQPAIWHSNQQDLDALIEWKNKYLTDYEAKDQHKAQWQNQLKERLKKLSEILHIEEILDQVPKQCCRLILIPFRYLYLFPLHALPVKESYLLDKFPKGVGYAPSCQFLQQVHLRLRSDFQSLFAIDAFIQVLDSQSKLIPTQDWKELEQLPNQLPEDNEEISEILENWLQPESRSQLLEVYKQNLQSISAKLPIDVDINLGIANSISPTPANQPSESSKELLENAIKRNSPLSDEKKSQSKR